MQNGRTILLFSCFIVLMISLFLSRGLLSACLIFFVAASFFHPQPGLHFRKFIQTPLLWGMSLLFFLPLVSGIWSEEKEQWLDIIRIKLPLLFLPLAFAGPFPFSRKQWEQLAGVFIAVCIVATGWSLFHYVRSSAEISEGYLRAKSLGTPLGNDHVRFSWMVYVATLLSGYLYWIQAKEKKQIRIVLLFAMGWLILYLHILAARTGLISLYISLFFLAFWMLVKRSQWRVAAALLTGLFIAPVFAYYFLPSFHNRVRYMKYDLEYFKKAHYLPGANDAVRVISLKTGWKIMCENQVRGIGFGDIYRESRKEYAAAYPLMLERDKIYPSSEWLMYGAGCGIPGAVTFAVVLCIPFFTGVRNRLPWWLLNGTAAFGFLADIGLEGQFGVFIYSFTILWCWKWLKE